MKCRHCDGTGKTNMYKDGEFVDCMYCGGTGEMEVEQTEQEYIQTCNHKELTEMLFRIIVNGSVIRPDRQYISEWLKQPHTIEE